MNLDEIASGFDDRPGFNLVDLEEVGLPVYRLTSTVLTLQPKTHSPIEEFVLRAVEAGLSSLEDISGFLGISRSIVEATASLLIKDDDLLAAGGNLRLTRKSERTLAGERLVRPREQSLVFRYDGLTRRPIRMDDLRLWEPRDLKERGIREIRAFPPRRPKPEEIRGDELQAVLRSPAQIAESATQILQVKTISRAYANFIPALALIFRRASGSEVQVAFAIDGRLSQDHERAFAECDGPVRMGITAGILAPQPVDTSTSKMTIAPPKAKAAGTKAQREKAIAKLRQQIAGKSIKGPDSKSFAETPSVLSTDAVELVAVYKHPPLLRSALEDAKDRLIIISPWITDAVVDQTFLAKLTDRLRRGVAVHIGYGLGIEDKVATAVKKLEKLASEFACFRFLRLGDTHAKILIKDSDWLVTTSFNWLSFRGDPKRTFREEWGTRVAIPEHVDHYAKTILNRMDEVQRKLK
jgi:hypothetical protein